ncbi:RNA polymerase sigma factor [Streptomyces sp. AC495_CC817]|uniref:RNA polymerase sigma factor n=1 Tax=Streptomyces sp. AC495_CC817 TaxID=2823900 RepID=UPI001C27D63E|nr:RNA polymerase sigma factor [Streptomyces sp. AC495_CC817]
MENDSDDRSLVRSLAAGDVTAFNELMRVHGSAVFRHLWSHADDSDVVEDLLQEVFLTLWRKRRQVQIYGDSLLPWLFVTARNIAFNHNRRERRRRTRAVSDEALEHALVGESAARDAGRDELRWVAQEISALSSVDQRLISLCFIEGLGYREVAVLAGMPEATARKRVQRIRVRLRAQRASND